MKSLWTISILVALSLVMAGCDLGGGGSSEYSWPEISSIEEITENGDVTRTEYLWDENYRTAALKRTVKGKVEYEDTGYECNEQELTVTYYRKFYGENGNVDHTHERVSTYAEYWYGPKKFESIDRSVSVDPLEKWEKTFDELGRTSSYKRYEEGVLVEERYDYAYHGTTDYPTAYTVKLPAQSPEVVKTVTIEYVTDGNRVYEDLIETKTEGLLVEYKRWSNHTSQPSYEVYKVVVGEDDILIEKQTDYAVDDLTVSYKITRYDENGQNPVVTRYNETYFIAKRKITY